MDYYNSWPPKGERQLREELKHLQNVEPRHRGGFLTKREVELNIAHIERQLERWASKWDRGH